MSSAFVLSGGGAAGDFEIGAVRLLLQRGIVPDILVGTSVGAINAAKIAEGEGKPTQGFAGLMAIWLSLRWNDDMWKPAAWVANVDIKFQRALGTMVAPVLSGPARSNNFIDEFVNGVSWLLDDGQKILVLLNEVTKARSLLTLEPITARINTSLDTAALAASGRKLRLGAISLETGRLRFVTETGAIMERDQVTPVGTMAGQVPASAALLQSEIATLDAEIRSLQTDLKDAPTGGKPALAAQINAKRQARDVKRAQLASALANVPRVPLRVPLASGILASASIGVVFPPVKLGDEFYVDGGHRDSLSADAASKLGATNIFCVLASPAELDPPTPDHPEPQVNSYATKTLLEIGLRAGLGIHLNEIVAADILRPSGFTGAFTLVAPRVSLHDMLTLDPGLIRQSIGYGFMRAADVVDQRDPASAVSKSAEAITMLRAQMWRKECELMGRPIPTAPDVDMSTPKPARYAEILADAATLRGLVANRAQQGGALPPEAARWGRTWEDHPWFANCAGPAIAISPGPDELEIFARAVDGRTMTGSWSPSSGWQGWRGVAHGFGAPSGWIEAIATGGEVHAFAVSPDGGIIQSVRTIGARVWSQWLPVGLTAQGNAASIEGSPVHAISTAPGRIDLFYANKLGSVVTTRWSATTGWSLPRFIGGAKTNPGGHVSVVSRNPQQIDIFMVAESRAIMTAGLTDGAAWTGWSPTSPGAVGMVGSYVSAVSRSTNLIDIFFADMNGKTTTSAFDPGRGWIHIGSIQGGVTSPGGCVTAIAANTNTLDVFCVGTDHRVYTAFWSPAGGWKGWIPTSATNAMPGLPVWPASRRTNQLDIVYTTVSNQILTAACAVSGAPWGGPWSINDHWQLDDLM